jgi:hypothetical protein
VTTQELRDRRAVVVAERDKAVDSSVIARCDRELNMIDLELWGQETHVLMEAV